MFSNLLERQRHHGSREEEACECYRQPSACYVRLIVSTSGRARSRDGTHGPETVCRRYRCRREGTDSALATAADPPTNDGDDARLDAERATVDDEQMAARRIVARRQMP